MHSLRFVQERSDAIEGDDFSEFKRHKNRDGLHDKVGNGGSEIRAKAKECKSCNYVWIFVVVNVDAGVIALSSQPNIFFRSIFITLSSATAHVPAYM